MTAVRYGSYDVDVSAAVDSIAVERGGFDRMCYAIMYCLVLLHVVLHKHSASLLAVRANTRIPYDQLPYVGALM